MNQYDIFIIKNQLQNLKIPKDKEKWQIQHIKTILNHLHFPNNILDLISEQKISKEKIFSLQLIAKQIIQTIQQQLDQSMIFPLRKLEYILNCVICSDPLEILSPKENSLSLIQFKSSRQTLSINHQSFVHYQSQIIRKFTKIFQDYLNQPTYHIITMTVQQVRSIMISAEVNINIIQLFKRLNIDGFGLICSASQDEFILSLRNFINQDSIDTIKYYAGIFVLMYLREMNQNEMISPQLQKNDTIQSSPLLSERRISINEKNQQEKVYQITAQQIIKELQDRDKSGLKLDKEIDQSQPRQSLQQSNYQGQSIAGSAIESVNMNSYYQIDNIATSDPNQFFSSIEQTENIKQIKSIAKNLDFNILNLQPLVHIKVTRLSNPFNYIVVNDSSTTGSINMTKKQTESNNEFKIFSLQGAKFGRDGNNEFCFPDEPSISSKHAQIYFEDENFYLRDLGSKTGTFLRVKQPTILNDDSCIQLSYQVELSIHIIKKQQNQGIIKIDFIKPQGFPGYQVFVKKNGYLKIGRSQQCNIRIDEQRTTIAQKHADIKYIDGDFVIIDRKSQKGSWIRLSKRSKISQGYKLKKGDIFRISSKRSYLVEDIKLLQTE